MKKRNRYTKKRNNKKLSKKRNSNKKKRQKGGPGRAWLARAGLRFDDDALKAILDDNTVPLNPHGRGFHFKNNENQTIPNINIISKTPSEEPAPKWACRLCTLKNVSSAQVCKECNTPRRDPPAPEPAAQKWACRLCTLKNVSSAQVCKACNTPRRDPPAPEPALAPAHVPAPAPAPAAQRAEAGEGPGAGAGAGEGAAQYEEMEWDDV